MNNLGQQTVVTIGVSNNLKDENFKLFLNDSLQKFINGDWGDTLEDSVKMNNEVLEGEKERLFAVYNIPEDLKTTIDEDSIWIITEWDKSVTTILFPSEY